MVLPLIIFEILLFVSIILFIFGASRQSMTSGFIFLTLSAVFFLITGLLLTQGGLELNTVSQFTNNPDGSTGVLFDVAANDFGSPVWAISQLFIYGSIGLVLISFILTVRQRKQLAYERQAQEF